ncbi:hypothetical protein MLD38_017151 [Melastoma candidum]|uniref:Uncharacterized protein n=1 Tax=Melastoma candidum TaxID=119954 RepID=A0ACB9QPQ1_9MYRT|nr:hypothetical protein MLD38_017151 [Melastoma candidum]
MSMESGPVASVTVVEPHEAMEFDSHDAAYSFYRDYARSVGFGTAKLSSRRSRASKEFIDAKFSCIRYGNKQQSGDVINPRPSPKIGCKASMHVKKRPGGNWYIYSFVKEHNHDLLPTQAHLFRSHRDADPMKNDASTRRRKNMPLASKSLSSYQNFDNLENYFRSPHDKGCSLILDSGDAQFMLDFFMHMQSENPKFFYAVDLNEENRLRSVFWVDAKGVEDYSKFGDVVSFDMSYFSDQYKMPLVLFVGVNHHIQPLLFGCALIPDDTVYTFFWLMQTWFLAMGDHAPQVILADQHDNMKAAIVAVFPNVLHCFSLWHVFDKAARQFRHLSLWHDKFMKKFRKSVLGSCSDEQFEKRWWKLVDRFSVREVEWVKSLYDDRKRWVPVFLKDISFAGLSTGSRSESVNSWFDKYVHKETSLRELLEKYKAVLEDRYEDEAKAEFDSWHEAPELKSPSPFEKQVSNIYTREIFQKFQIEILGAAACHLKKNDDDENATIYNIKDLEGDQNHVVEWDKSLEKLNCSCRTFQFRGYLCRHTIIVLQMSGIFSIPSRYILQRWTNAALSRHAIGEKMEEVQSKVQRYNDLCRRAIILAEEGSLYRESYCYSLSTIDEAHKQCTSLSNSWKNEMQPDYSVMHVIPCNEEVNQSCSGQKPPISDPKLASRRKAPRNADSRRENVLGDNQSSKKGKEMSEVRPAPLHHMLPMQLHSMAMCPGAASSQFYHLASMQLPENSLP